MKKCVQCLQERKLLDFLRDNRTQDGYCKICLFCVAAKQGLSKKEYERRLLAGSIQRQHGIDLTPKHRQKIREWAKVNSDKMREYERRYHKQNPQIAKAANHRRKARKSNTTENIFTEQDRRDLIQEYEGRCAYCSTKVIYLEMDHIIPLSQGGQHTKSNIVPACFNCNRSKGKKTPEQVGMIISRRQND